MIRNPYTGHPHCESIVQHLQEKGNGVYHLKGLSGSSRAGLLQSVLSRMKGTHLVIFRDKEEAAYFYTDLVALEETPERTLFFPSSYKRSVQYKQTDEANIITRTQTLKRLNEKRVASFIITHADALLERVITRAELGRNTLEIKSGEKLDREFMEEVLQTYGFQLVDFVYEPGQYAIRGGIVDIFSFSASEPCRIDFFGDEVDSLRYFDVETQRSRESVNKVSIIPNLQWEQNLGEKRVSFLDYIPAGAVLWLDDLELMLDHVRKTYEKTEFDEEQDAALVKSGFLVNHDQLVAGMQRFRRVEFMRPVMPGPDNVWTFNTDPQPQFNKNFELLAENLKQNSEKGYENFILSENPNQIERLRAIFDEIDPDVQFQDVPHTIHEGFTDHDLKISIYTDHQIFERYHKFKLHDRFTKKESLTVKELTGLNPGDYVVHVDHGIGVFGGLEKIHIKGRVQEAVKLVYKDNDVLFVNIHSLHRISRYKGKEGHAPRVYKLGTGAWQKLKQKTKSN